jgi:hypothetical protein
MNANLFLNNIKAQPSLANDILIMDVLNAG